MRWRAICERRFERVVGDRTGFVPLDSNTDQPFDGPPGPAVSPIAEQPPLVRRPSSRSAQSFRANPADAAESSASRAQMGAGESWGAARGPWRGANTAHSKPKPEQQSSQPALFAVGGSARRPAAAPPPPRRRAALGPMPYGTSLQVQDFLLPNSVVSLNQKQMPKARSTKANN